MRVLWASNLQRETLPPRRAPSVVEVTSRLFLRFELLGIPALAHPLQLREHVVVMLIALSRLSCAHAGDVQKFTMFDLWGLSLQSSR